MLFDKERLEELNYIAIAVLEELGNQTPSQEQIDLVEKLLASIKSYQRTEHDKKISLKENRSQNNSVVI